MASGLGLALPETLSGDDAKSWFRRFEVCATANDWDDPKKLRRLPTLLKGRAWAVYDSLSEEQVGTYTRLKKELLARLSPDTEEDRLCAREQLSKRRLHEDRESVDELARDLEKLLDKAAPDLPSEVREAELRYHLINALPERVAFQLKLLPKEDYSKTITKARELSLIYRRADAAASVNLVHPQQTRDPRLDRLEDAVKEMTQQLAVLTTRQARMEPSRRCFKCGRPGHLARNCRSYTANATVCFRCGARGHLARACWNQGNDQGGAPNRRAWGAPGQR